MACVAELFLWQGLSDVGLIVVGLGIAWLWLWSTPLFTNYLGRTIESKFPPVPVEETESADAIVILGGGVRPVLPPRLYPELNVSGNRVLHAARLYKAGKATWIVLTGWAGYRPADNEPEKPNPTCVILGELGIPEEVVLVENQSLNTHENAQFAKRIIDDHQIESIILVTSAMHMPRAVVEFRAVCRNVIPAPIDFGTAAMRNRILIDLLPATGALNLGSEVLHEIVGLVLLRFRR
jgi:uncharacterized SAM-binding protein YcdF (DUF218 family)